jgi:hypothetical protein
MVKYYLTVLIVLMATQLAGCSMDIVLPDNSISIVGSGNLVSREEDIAGFDRIDVSQAFQIDIRQGEEYSVIVRVDDNVVEYLQVVKEGNTLVIDLDSSLSSGYSFTNVTMEAEVTMPSLTGVDASGACDVTVTGFASSESLDVHLSGSSSLEGDIEAGDARIHASGASDVDLTGSAQDLTLDVSGSSEANLANFAAIDAEVEASGASEVVVNVTGRLDADTSGSSSVYYSGDPTLGRIDSSGSSSVRGR